MASKVINGKVQSVPHANPMRWVVRIGIVAIAVVAGWIAGVPRMWVSSDAASGQSVSSSSSEKLQLSSLSQFARSLVQNTAASAPTVPMPLVLVGIMPGRNAQDGRALLGKSKSSALTYQAGALLENGVRLAAIYADHVTLEKNGHSVDLYLEDSGRRNDNQALQDILTASGPAPLVEAAPVSHEALTDYIRPSPAFNGTFLRGYQVYSGSKAAVFSQLGLENGDVITSINGMPLTEPQTAIEQLQQLTQGISVTAVVERSGEIRTVLLDGALIVHDQQRQATQSDMFSGPPH